MFVREGFEREDKLRVGPWLKADQWWDALLLRRRDVQGGIYSKWNTDEWLYVSHAGHLCVSLSLRFSANLRAVTLRKRLDLLSASSSYLTHTPRVTHATKGAFSPRFPSSPGPALPFRTPTCAIHLDWLASADWTWQKIRSQVCRGGWQHTRRLLFGDFHYFKRDIPNCSPVLFLFS